MVKMEISDSTSKYSDKEGVEKSVCLVKQDRDNEYDSQTWRQVEEIFGASAFMGGGDGITEMMNGIATSIQFDDVLEELQQLFAKISENNEVSHKVKDTLPDYGSGPALTNEITEPNCVTISNADSQQITNMLHGLSAVTAKQGGATGGNKDSQQITKRFRDVPAEVINRSYRDLLTDLSEGAQKTEEEYRPKQHREQAQDLYTDNKNSQQITTMLEDVSKENINNSCEELRTVLTEASDRTVKEKSLKFREELAKDVYADVFDDRNELLVHIPDTYHKAVLGFGRELVERQEVGFRKVVQKFGDGLVCELGNWYEAGLIENTDELKVELEEEIKKLTKDSVLKLKSVCDTEINGHAYHLGSYILSDFVKRVKVRGRFSAPKDLNRSIDIYLGSSEIQNELHAVISNKDDAVKPQSESQQIVMEKRNKKCKKHPLKKLWHNIKKVFCVRAAKRYSCYKI